MGAPPPEYPQAFRSKGVATKVGSSQQPAAGSLAPLPPKGEVGGPLIKVEEINSGMQT